MRPKFGRGGNSGGRFNNIDDQPVIFQFIGLLLRSDLHTLFDLGLLWITQDHKVAIARHIEGHRLRTPEGQVSPSSVEGTLAQSGSSGGPSPSGIGEVGRQVKLRAGSRSETCQIRQIRETG